MRNKDYKSLDEQRKRFWCDVFASCIAKFKTDFAADEADKALKEFDKRFTVYEEIKSF